MAIRARCPSCQSEYTLVDSLRGKHVRCQHCREPFQAVAVKDGRTTEPAPSTELPSFQWTPPAVSGLPRTILNTGGHPVKDVPALPTSPRQSRRSSGGGGGARVGFPLGIVFIAVMAIRACVSLSSSSSSNNSRWETPKSQTPNAPGKVGIQFMKDKDIGQVPNQPKGGKALDIIPPWLPGKDKDKTDAPGGRK
jgi:predicted Zn finger-like uncharacterized protein